MRSGYYERNIKYTWPNMVSGPPNFRGDLKISDQNNWGRPDLNLGEGS